MRQGTVGAMDRIAQAIRGLRRNNVARSLTGRRSNAAVGAKAGTGP